MLFADSPFLLDSLTISIVASAKSFSTLPLGSSATLVYGLDYVAGLLFNQATAELGVPVYGAIVFVDPELTGTINVNLTSVGSQYAPTVSELANALVSQTLDPLSVWWEQAFPNIPTFPRTNLEYNATVMSSFVEISVAIDSIATQEGTSSNQKSIQDYTLHIADTGNPHSVSAEQVGLGKVPNWTTATASTLIAGGSATEFVTPSSIKDSIGTIAPVATQEVVGITQLNRGTSVDDATNDTDGVTSAGLIYMLDNNLITSGASLANNQRQEVQFTPFPIVYPATWSGVVCNTFEALVQAVENQTGFANLTAIAQTGIIYFPHTATAPSLALS